jgi:ABC-type sugar transport system, periplasmic component
MKKKIIAVVMAAIMVAATMLVGCSNDKNSSTKEKKPIKILSIWAEDKDNGKLIMDITERYIAEQDPDFTYEFELVSAQDLRQKIATLLASNDLPDVFVYESGAPIKELIAADKLLDVGAALEDLGVRDLVDEGAVSLLTTLSGTEKLYDLPLGLNVEGFWYNKALFEQAGIKEAPETWADFEKALEALDAAGIQPLVTAGADSWPATRLVNAYTFRSLGAEAMKKASLDEAKYTDAGYVAAAAKIQEFANKGYFGEGVTTVDSTTAGQMLMNGQAAIYYNGSWFTENLTNPEANKAGEDGIGFFNVPVVDPAISSITEYSMNCGNILAFDKEKYNDNTAGWLKFFVENIGDEAMSQFGAVKGYKYTVEGDMNTYTQMVAEHLGKATSSTTWYEANMISEISTPAQEGVQTLLNGDFTPEEYMQSIQDAHDMSK